MDCVEYSKEDGIATLTINRPDALNALNRDVLEKISEYVNMVSMVDGIRALIVKGAGDKAFIAGADIKQMEKMSPMEMLDFCQLGQDVSLSLERAPFVTIAAVNGYALGGGLEMALACDFIYATPESKLGLPEVNLGIIPGFGGTQRLTRAVGTRLAKEMILSGKIIDAHEAYRIGIVNQLLDKNTIYDVVYSLARQISKNSSNAIIQAKYAINAAEDLGMREGLELERNLCTICFDTEERAQAMKAFTNKMKGKK